MSEPISGIKKAGGALALESEDGCICGDRRLRHINGGECVLCPCSGFKESEEVLVRISLIEAITATWQRAFMATDERLPGHLLQLNDLLRQLPGAQ